MFMERNIEFSKNIAQKANGVINGQPIFWDNQICPILKYFTKKMLLNLLKILFLNV